MTTFVLSKYNTVDPKNTPQQPKDTDEDLKIKKEEEKKEQKLLIDVAGSVSALAARALYKALKSRDIELEIIEATKKQQEANNKILSQETINSDPLAAFNQVSKGDVVFIENNGFKTKEDEWFLSNILTKTNKVFYTPESFAKHLIHCFESQEWIDENGEGFEAGEEESVNDEDE